MAKKKKRLIRWSEKEVERLDKWAGKKSVSDIAARFQRSQSAVRQKMLELNISIRERRQNAGAR